MRRLFDDSQCHTFGFGVDRVGGVAEPRQLGDGEQEQPDENDADKDAHARVETREQLRTAAFQKL